MQRLKTALLLIAILAAYGVVGEMDYQDAAGMAYDVTPIALGDPRDE